MKQESISKEKNYFSIWEYTYCITCGSGNSENEALEDLQRWMRFDKLPNLTYDVNTGTYYMRFKGKAYVVVFSRFNNTRVQATLRANNDEDKSCCIIL
jgi:myo-inositol-hexaphosphate 3-phosphohydrolase